MSHTHLHNARNKSKPLLKKSFVCARMDFFLFPIPFILRIHRSSIVKYSCVRTFHQNRHKKKLWFLSTFAVESVRKISKVNEKWKDFSFFFSNNNNSCAFLLPTDTQARQTGFFLSFVPEMMNVCHIFQREYCKLFVFNGKILPPWHCFAPIKRLAH